MAKSMALKIFSFLMIFSCCITMFAGKSTAGVKSIDELLKRYYEGEWEILKTEKSLNTVYKFYQRDTIYSAPDHILLYVWSTSPKNDEDDFNPAVMGYASTNFERLPYIKGLKPGMSVRNVDRVFEKYAANNWRRYDYAASLLDDVKKIHWETKSFYIAGGMISIVVSFKNGKAYFVEYFNDGDRDDYDKRILDRGGELNAGVSWQDVFVKAIGDMKRYEWERPFNEWVWRAKSGGMERISGGELSIKDSNLRQLSGAFGAVYCGRDAQDNASAFVMFINIPSGNNAPLISSGWLTFGSGEVSSNPEYGVNISRRNNQETISFRKKFDTGEAWTIDCGRLNQPYREYREGTVAVYRENTANGGIRFWLVDIKP
ncbi:MAG: hypothetical protein LBQ58_05080 [Synergistaceae bacterium]|jgi:hypothetical protein|nr:hypothetical protein [Synergistaceae bacterium]